MTSTIKSVLFWFAIIVAAFAIYQYASLSTPHGVPPPPGTPALEGEWTLGSNANQRCAVFRQGEVLLLVNERGDMATARLDGSSRLTVLKGDGWESGLTAEIRDGGKTLAWRDGSTWTRR